jgi:hypothetical protein
MPGTDRQQSTTFCYISVEQKKGQGQGGYRSKFRGVVPRAREGRLWAASARGLSVAGDPRDGGRGAKRTGTALRGDLREQRMAVDCNGAAVAGVAVAGVYTVRSERLLMEQLEL